MRLCAVLLVVALINWWLSVPVEETPRTSDPDDTSHARGSYAGDALIFMLCLAGVLYERKQKREREE